MVHGRGKTGGVLSGEQGLSRGVFTVALALSLWLALGSLVLALADGGPHPTRRAVIGVVLVVASVAALWQRRRVCAWLRALVCRS